MLLAKVRLPFVTVFALCLAFCIPLLASTQSDEETALRALAEKFFAAYQKEDLDGVMLLWSEKSPDLASSKQSIQQAFAAVDKIELKSLSIHKVTVNGDKATVRVVIEINAVDAKTGKLAADFGKLNRTLHCVKENVVWKLWRYVSSEEELAAGIVAAKTDEERKALLEAEKELITVELVGALTTEGDNLVNRSSYPQAMSVFQIALNVAKQIDDKKGIATVLRSMGIIYNSQGRYLQALELYQNSLKLAEKIGDKQGISRALCDMGDIYRSQGSYTQALEHYQKSLKLAEELGDKEHISRVLGNIGFVQSYQNNYTQALEYYQKSLMLAEELGDKIGISRVLNRIGIIHSSQGNYAQALEYYHKSLRLSEELGYKQGIADALTNIGNVHGLQGNYGQSLEYYQKSLKLSEELGYKYGISAVLSNIGLVYHLQGDYAQALGYHQKSLRLAEEMDDKEGIYIALKHIGNVHEFQGNYAQALEYYQKSLKLEEEIGDKLGISDTLNNIGNIHNIQGNYAQAIESAQQAIAVAHHTGNSEYLWQSHPIAGRAYRALNQPDQARQAFADAIATIEALRGQVAGGEQEQQRFFENKVSPYYDMIDLLINQNNAAEAFAYAERAKGRVLLDVLSSGKVNISKAMTQDEQRQERKLNGELISLNTQIYREKARQQPDDARLKDLNTQLQKARLEYEAFQTNLYAAHPELKARRGEAQSISLNEAAALIPDTKTGLLEFVVMEDKTHLFVLTKDKDAAQAVPDLKVYTLNIKQKDLADRARRFRKRLAGLDFSFYDLSGPLYDLLLKPARAQLQTKTTLVIVPDNALWELPFQALMPARNRYLIEDHAIYYAPSLTVLREMTKARRNHNQNTVPAETLLAFGNPAIGKKTDELVKSVFMDEKMLPLPEAERQVKLLGQLYGPSHSRVYVGADAREDRAKAEAGKCRILHFATHGILNDSSPMYSQVVLSQHQENSAEDGLLEAWEIMNLDLKADLVILSACETARGRVGAGEGVIGLSWALFVAGCPTTVVSQWKVESASTTELMVEFHRTLKPKIENPKSKVTRAEALRQAALKMLKSKQYRHPFYWAGFVIVGDGS